MAVRAAVRVTIAEALQSTVRSQAEAALDSEFEQENWHSSIVLNHVCVDDVPPTLSHSLSTSSSGTASEEADSADGWLSGGDDGGESQSQEEGSRAQSPGNSVHGSDANAPSRSDGYKSSLAHPPHTHRHTILVLTPARF